jgi:aminomethyltransferase
LKTTQLYSYHRSHAKLIEFAGYDMPLWYTTTSEEHMAVRNDCGVFDVSHMGRFMVSGERAGELLEGLVPTHVQSQPIGKSFYTLFLNSNGGIVDDLIIVKMGDKEFLVVVNAANSETDMKHIREHAPSTGVDVDDITHSSAMIAVQGPRSAAILQKLTPLDLSQFKRFRSANATVSDQSTIISRTGYTGEDGFELVVLNSTNERPEGALNVWNKVVSASAACGLGARDSLRLEAGYPLHGFDIDPETNPYASDLGWVISADKTGYVGYETIAKLRNEPPTEVKRGVVLERGIPRHAFEVRGIDSNMVGVVTSGSFSPILKRGIALCRLRPDYSSIGAKVRIAVRDKEEEGQVVKPPFYSETEYGWRRR